MTRAKHRAAIVGAGIAGLACAGRLREAGVAVSLFDKGRSPGGRCATRRAGAFAFDHGAQYVTASDERFRKSVAAAEAAGFAVPWHGAPATLPASGAAAREDAGGRWIGVSGMNGLPRHLGRGLQIRANTRIVAVERASTGTAAAGASRPRTAALPARSTASSSPSRRRRPCRCWRRRRRSPPRPKPPCWRRAGR